MTAGELAALWEPLTARCAELRPVGQHGDKLDFHPAAGEYRMYAASIDEGVDQVFAVPEETVAALWRDAAVRWLAKRMPTAIVGTAQGRWFVAEHAYDGQSFPECPTLDHALAAAVLAVLDRSGE